MIDIELQKDMDKYKKHMNAIARRLDLIDACFDGRINFPYCQATVEFVYLQVRLILETIIALSLDAAGQEIRDSLLPNKRKSKSPATRIRQALEEKIDPDCLPCPVTLEEPDDEGKKQLSQEQQGKYRGNLVPTQQNYEAAKAQWLSLYRKSSGQVHESFQTSRILNPEEVKDLLKEAADARKQLYSLLKHHIVPLRLRRENNGEHLCIAQLVPPWEGETKLDHFERVES